MPVSDWNDLCPQIIVWEPMTSRDVFGKPLFAGTPVTFRGRRSYKRSRVRSRGKGATGITDAISESEIIILGIPDVHYDDRCYVQGDTEDFPPILSIERTPDENGELYCKVMLGSANG